MKQLASIIITNYNKEKYIEKCLKSCLNQDYSKIEIILIDNCSSDNSVKIIKRLKKIPIIFRKKKFKSPSDNQLDAILFALKKTKGELIFLLDSDDYFKKNKVSAMMKYFNDNKKLRFTSDIPIKVNKDNKTIFRYSNRDNIIKIWPTIFPTSSIVFKKQLKKKIFQYIKVDKFNKLEVDFRLCVLANLLEKKTNRFNNNLTFYTQDTNGIMSNYKTFSLNWWQKRYQAHLFLFKLLRKFNMNKVNSLDYFTTKALFYLNFYIFSLFTRNKK